MNKYLILTFCFILVSCKNSTETNVLPTPKSVIMPLAINNEWAYIDIFGGGGPISFTNTDTIKFISTFVFGADTVYVNPVETYYTNRSDGLWTETYGSPNQTLIAKYPAQPGDIFGHDSFTITVPSDPIPNDTLSAQIVVDSINALVTVPAGNYTCYRYRADYYGTKHILVYRQNAYYSVNTGMIKRESFWLDSASQQLKLNESYQLTKAILH